MQEIRAKTGLSYSYVTKLIADPDGSKEKKRRGPRKWTSPAAVANRKRYCERHKERLREAARKRQAEFYKTPEGAAYGAAYREAHREEARRRTREWVRANPDRKRQQMETRRARMLNAPEIEKVDRAAIIARDHSVCHICRRKVGAKDMTLDHLVPLSKGGPHTAANLSVAHRSCNSRRHAGRLPAQLRLIG